MLINPGASPAQAPEDKPKSSLAGRTWQMIRRNPSMIATLLREEFRQRWGISLDRRYRRGRRRPPVSLHLDLTRRCNLKWVMGEQHRHQPGSPTAPSWYDPARELPLAAWKDLLGQVASFRPRLYITGGEPLLYSHFAELVREAKRRKLIIHLQTNGTLLSRAADLLGAAGMETVTVSLYGPPAAPVFAQPAGGVACSTTWIWTTPSPRSAKPCGRAAGFCPTAPCLPVCT